jgi:hypothetical protein
LADFLDHGEMRKSVLFMFAMFCLSFSICYMQVCTFKLVLKNAASLLPDNDPVKLSAVAALDDLIRSAFRFLCLRSCIMLVRQYSVM